jgi:hypothetical protein
MGKIKKPPSASLLGAGAADRWQVPTRSMPILLRILSCFPGLQELFFTRTAFPCSRGIEAARCGFSYNQKSSKILA